MDPITGIGLGLQGVSLLSQLFGESPEEKARRYQEEQRRQAISYITSLKQKALGEGISRIGRLAAGNLASSRSAAMQRAAAAGRSGEAESYILPIEAKAAGEGNEAMSRYVQDVNRQYDTALQNITLSGLQQPYLESPNWSDYAQTIGSGLTRYGLLSQKNTPTDYTPPEVPPAGSVSPTEMFGNEPPQPIEEQPPVEGAFRVGGTEKSFNIRPEDVMTMPETGLYSQRRPYAGLRRANIFSPGY